MPNIPFDQLYDTVQGLKAQPGMSSDKLDQTIIAAGYNPAEYLSHVKKLRAGSGGPLGGGAIEAFAKGFTDTAAFGYADELGAMIDATSGLVSGKGDDFSKLFNKSLEDRRVSAADFGKRFPKSTVTGNIAGGLAEAPVLPGLGSAASLPGAVARGAGEGAIAGALYGSGSGKDGIGNRAASAAGGAATGLAVGGAAGGIGHGIQAGLGALAGPGTAAVDRTGALTPEAAQIASRAGIDLDTVTPDIAQELGQRLAGARGDETSIPAALRQIIAGRQGVTLAGPQATRSNAKLGDLQGMMAGTKGSRAESRVKDFMAGQQEQVAQAAENLGQRVAPNAILGMGEADAGQAIGQSVANRAEQSRQAVRSLYQSTGAENVVIPGADTADLIPNIMQRLQGSNLNAIRPERAPAFGDIMDTLRANVVGQNTTLAHLDDVRKSLGALVRGSKDATERSMASTALAGFDNWLDDAVNKQSSTLPAASLQGVKDARAASRDWFRTYEADPHRTDTVGPIIEQIREKVANPELGGSTWQDIFNAITGGGDRLTERAVPVAQRIRGIVGEQSPEWQTAQLGVTRRILFGNADKQSTDFQPGEQAWRTMATRIQSALDGQGERATREILGDDAVAQLRQLAEVAKTLAVPAKAANPSGSGYTVQRASTSAAQGLLSNLLSGTGAYLGAAAGGPLGAVVGAGAGIVGAGVQRGYRNVRGGQRALTLLEPYRPPPTTPGALSGLGMLATPSPALSGELGAVAMTPDAETRGRRNLLGAVTGVHY